MFTGCARAHNTTHTAKTTAESQDRSTPPTGKARPPVSKAQEAAEKAKIADLLDRGPGKLYDPSQRRPNTPTNGGKAVLKANPAVVMMQVIGTARNAKLGAIVVSKSGTYFIEGLAAWPVKLAGKQIEVSGKLVQRKLAPTPKVGKDGAVSAGAHGMSQVLTDATYKAHLATP